MSVKISCVPLEVTWNPLSGHVTTSLHHSYLGHLSPPLRSIHSQRRLRKAQRLERYTSYAQNLQFSCSRSKCSGINVQGSLGSCFEFYSAALVLAFGGYPAIQLHLWSTIPLLYARGLGKEEKWKVTSTIYTQGSQINWKIVFQDKEGRNW